MKNSYLVIMLSIYILISGSCTKILEIPNSKSQVESTVVFKDSTIATAALLGAYYTLGVANANMKSLGLYTDEITFPLSSGIDNEYQLSQVSSNNATNQSAWNVLYSVIFQCNSILEGMEQSVDLSKNAKVQFTAEAKFLRAFANFYLVNLYDHIPLMLTTDVNLNRKASQAASNVVYDQIIKDLLEAKKDLGNTYLGIGKVRANKMVCSALLSRIYLFQERWEDARTESTLLINSGLYDPLPKLEDLFIANSSEAIFQLWMNNGFLTDAAQLIPASSTVVPTYPIILDLVNSFENTDGRKSKWLGTNTVITNGVSTVYYYPNKYKNRVANTGRPEYVMTLRLGEQYLIRAEAAAQLGNISEAVSDLNVIRRRAGINDLQSNITKDVLLNAIALERRHELFGEWGHRFLDLKRTKQLDQVIGSLKTTWAAHAKALPIPFTEIVYNANLKQNNGY